MWEVMFWPIVACVLLPWLLVYLGLHVVQRGIIFIDIAMAQMASLGICVAVLLRIRTGQPGRPLPSRWLSLWSARPIFAVTGKRTSQVPQEAIIGIAYVVSAAAAVLLLSRSAAWQRRNSKHARRRYHCGQRDRSLEMLRCLRRRRRFSFRLAAKFPARFFRSREEPTSRGCGCAGGISFLRHFWTGRDRSLSAIAGVLLVFSYLIVPAVCAVSPGSLRRHAVADRLGRLAHRRCRRICFSLSGGIYLPAPPLSALSEFC